MTEALRRLIRWGEATTLNFAAQHAPQYARTIQVVARAFGVPASDVARRPQHFQNRLQLQKAGVAFQKASVVRGWIAEGSHNLARAAGQIPQLVYMENTARHAAASVVHAGAAVVGGVSHLSDSYHQIHRAIDPLSIITGRDMTEEGLQLQAVRAARIAALPPAQRAKARLGPELTNADLTKSWVDGGKAFARKIDIDHPDGFQRFVGNVAGALPGLGAAAINPALGAAVFASQGADSAYDDAIGHGASRQTAQNAATINGVIDGVLTFIPGEKLLGRFVPAAGNASLKIGRKYFNKAIAGGGLTTTMGVVENATANLLQFDPKRPWLAGADQDFINGAVLGAVLPGGGRQDARPSQPRPTARPRPLTDAAPPLDIAVDAARGTRLVRTEPEVAKPLLRKIAPHARVRIATQPVQDYVATLPSSEGARFLNETGIGAQLPADTALPQQVEIDLPTYLSVLARDQGPGAFPGAHEAVADDAEVVANRATGTYGNPTTGGQVAQPGAGAATGASSAGTSEVAGGERSARPDELTASVPNPTSTDPAPTPDDVGPSPGAISSGPDVEQVDQPPSVDTGSRPDAEPASVPPAGINSAGSFAEPPTSANEQAEPKLDLDEEPAHASQIGGNSDDLFAGLPFLAKWHILKALSDWAQRGRGPDLDHVVKAGLQPAGAEPRSDLAAGDRESTGDAAEPTRGVFIVDDKLAPPVRPAAIRAREYQDGTEGTLYDIQTRKNVVVALRFDNPNPHPRAQPFVRFDGFRVLDDGRVELIDAKTKLMIFRTSKGLKVAPKAENQLKNQSRALDQNPGYVGIIEVPNEALAAEARDAISKLSIRNIFVRVRP